MKPHEHDIERLYEFNECLRARGYAVQYAIWQNGRKIHLTFCYEPTFRTYAQYKLNRM